MCAIVKQGRHTPRTGNPAHGAGTQKRLKFLPVFPCAYKTGCLQMSFVAAQASERHIPGQTLDKTVPEHGGQLQFHIAAYGHTASISLEYPVPVPTLPVNNPFQPVIVTSETDCACHNGTAARMPVNCPLQVSQESPSKLQDFFIGFNMV